VRDFRDRLVGDIPGMPAERRERRQEHLRRAVGAAVAPGSSAMSAIVEPVSRWRLIATRQKERRKSAVFPKKPMRTIYESIKKILERLFLINDFR
jgi:hypothetical protein